MDSWKTHTGFSIIRKDRGAITTYRAVILTGCAATLPGSAIISQQAPAARQSPN
jgi:hypothetical protein